MSGCGEGAEWVEQLWAPRQGHCTSQSQPVKATLLRRAVTLCATVAGWLRRQNGLIWYYLVHDDFFVSGLDWGTIIPIFNMGFFVMLILRMLYKKLTTYSYSIDIVQAMP